MKDLSLLLRGIREERGGLDFDIKEMKIIVDEKGVPVTDPHKVNALVPMAGAKGYGLMMLVDVFSGVLLGVPFGKHVSSMYHDLSEGRGMGQLLIVMDPARFVGIEQFKQSMYVTSSASRLRLRATTKYTIRVSVPCSEKSSSTQRAELTSQMMFTNI